MAAMKKWTVKVKNPMYCGEGAGGAQFAYGEATITNPRLAAWFKAHDGYTVTEVKETAAKAEKA